MPFGINTFLFSSPFSTREASLFEKVARLGFQVFEMAIEDPELIDAAEGRAQLEKYGLKPVVCTVVGPERNLAADDDAVYQVANQYLNFCIDFAAQVGAKVICGPFHSAVAYTELLSDSERSRVLERVSKRLRPLAAKAADNGVLLAFETLNRFENCLINTTEQALELVKMVDSPALGIHLDTFHMNIEEKDMPAAIRLAGPVLYHFHTCENDRGILGTGHIPWKDIAVALREVNYHGDFVIESFTDQVRSIARAVSTWRKVAPSSEVLAEKGLQFLKSNFVF
ncbi:MAG TPA: sugar phosphate isomerase/epimerase [Firmicutes bacterium]|jgi:D-psicose/D-tagatose/L-ribulose 3-epimerase|nr:sugar phosphate isomerase/epimerase [Bacillota bacterium]